MNLVAESLTMKHGNQAASLLVAEKYVSAFEKLAKTNNTLILPSNAGDVSSFVAQALAVYKTVTTKEDLKFDNLQQEFKQLENESLGENTNVCKENSNVNENVGIVEEKK